MEDARLALALAVTLSCLTGCNADKAGPAPTSESPPPTLGLDANSMGAILTAAVPNEMGEAMAALISGRVDVDDEGCVVLVDGDDIAQAVVWPLAWTAQVEGGLATVRTPSGALLAETGDTILGSGGSVPVSSLGGVVVVDTDARCFPSGASSVTFLQEPGKI